MGFNEAMKTGREAMNHIRKPLDHIGADMDHEMNTEIQQTADQYEKKNNDENGGMLALQKPGSGIEETDQWIRNECNEGTNHKGDEEKKHPRNEKYGEDQGQNRYHNV